MGAAAPPAFTLVGLSINRFSKCATGQTPVRPLLATEADAQLAHKRPGGSPWAASRRRGSRRPSWKGVSRRGR